MHLPALEVEVDVVVGQDARELFRDPAQLEDGHVVHLRAILSRKGGSGPEGPLQETIAQGASTLVGGLILPAMICAFSLAICASQALGILAFLLIFPRETPLFFRLKTRSPPFL